MDINRETRPMESEKWNGEILKFPETYRIEFPLWKLGGKVAQMEAEHEILFECDTWHDHREAKVLSISTLYW